MSSARYSRRRTATLLYDEECGLCRATAAWLGHRVSASALRLLPLGDARRDPGVGPQVAGRDLKAMLHLVDGKGSIRTGARAVLAAGRLVPRWRLLATAFDHRLGHLVLEPAYRLVSAHRGQVSRLLRLPATCAVPQPAERPGATGRDERESGRAAAS